MKIILFKELSELEQNIIYKYNARCYTSKIENAKIFISAQKEILNKLIEKHKKVLSEYSINRIKFYVSKHRKYHSIEYNLYGR